MKFPASHTEHQGYRLKTVYYRKCRLFVLRRAELRFYLRPGYKTKAAARCGLASLLKELKLKEETRVADYFVHGLFPAKAGYPYRNFSSWMPTPGRAAAEPDLGTEHSGGQKVLILSDLFQSWCIIANYILIDC